MVTHRLNKNLETQREYLLTHTNHKNERVRNSAVLWLQTLEAESGNKIGAKEAVKSTSINEVAGVEIRLNWSNDLLNLYDDEKGAEVIFDELIKADASESTLKTIEAIKKTAFFTAGRETGISKKSNIKHPDRDSGVFPEEFMLEQNFPNPFNPSTTIRFHLPEESKVTITIYDMLGQVVRSLVYNSIYRAGIHEKVWNGLNKSGDNLSSGVYFYTIKAIPISGGQAFNDSRKFIFIR